MGRCERWVLMLGLCCASVFGAVGTRATAAEGNPIRAYPVVIGPEAHRIIVGLRSGAADAADVARRAGLAIAISRQITPLMHVLYLPRSVYGAGVEATLATLRRDPAVKFADVDQRRYARAVVPKTPNDPLFQPSSGATGQWFMLTPTTTSATSDWSATDAVSAWGITTGSTGIVIADVDTGVRFDHPDLLRAGEGGRLLPGYDFVGEDYDSNGNALGTFLIANDGDGWDPDPSDPGDWISATDQKNALFPASECPVADSSWHGTRVVGILGALTNNGVGLAGMTWGPYLLPVRALGKCSGYDSDIIAGMQWAAGMAVSGVPNNPYPASIINLSLGGSGACPQAYSAAIAPLIASGVLIVASAGNGSTGSAAPVDAPANCAGVLAVAGLRNVGTKVGYSSMGPEVGISAPAGNCVNAPGAGPCLRSIDTTTNAGLTAPAADDYTDQLNPNLGTSFSAPIVAGIAALMRSVNGNLTPAQLIARLQASANPFPPNTAGIPVCPNTDSSGECACTTSQCGAGMVDALGAVQAALRPIAAVAVPASAPAGQNAVFDAGGSAAACNLSTNTPGAIASYQWTATSGITIELGATSSKVTIIPGSGSDTLTLTVTDSLGATDAATILVSGGTATTAAPTTAGSAACPAALTLNVAAPTVTESFSPASVTTNASSMFTISLNNSNGFALTQSTFSTALPGNLTIPATPAASTTCTGAALAATYTSASISMSNANIPANGSCTVTVPVQSATAGTYTSSIAAHALATAPAGGNSAAASAVLTVTPPSHGGGGALSWGDLAGVAGIFAAGRFARRRSSRGPAA
jgi:serine protease